MKKAIIIILLLVLISNLPPIKLFLSDNYVYSNSDYSFQCSEEGGKGNSYRTCVLQYGHFLCQHPEKDQGDNRLYRNFTIKPWEFWNWSDYIFHNDRFTLPYLSPKK